MANSRVPKKWISEQACVSMAHTCNLYCVYCHNPPTGEKKDAGQTAAEMKAAGVKAVSLEGGGEPTASPDFFKWIKALKAAGVKDIMLSTNAVALADRAFCRKAVPAVNFFTVNFPSHRPEVYARITRSVKFPQAVRGLANIKALGGEEKIRFFHIISSENYRLLPGFANWAAKNFPRAAFINFTFVRNKGRAPAAPGIVPSYREVAPFLALALASLKLRGFRAVVQNMPLCALAGVEGFSFEYQRWRRGDKVLEGGVDAAAPCRACARCTLAPACCGARPDYIKVRGAGELKASKLDPRSIIPEDF
ncbi:MAG TPA: radical SAM protein [Elusimicrobiales bacterium]|nr:radical SAM protein [Elusimicrobiales bacterium]